MGNIVEGFGKKLQEISDKDPAMARRLLLAAYRSKRMQLKLFPGKNLHKASQHAALETFDLMIDPLAHPQRSAIISLFLPCELLFAADVAPYSCEGLGGFLSGTHAERTFLQYAENEGLPETFCSYHKVFIGAAEKGLMPKPRFVINTTLACDANLLTFRRLAEYYNVEQFVIDVPYHQDEDAVDYVAKQLRNMKSFIEQQMGTNIDEEKVRIAVERSRRSMENYSRYMTLRADKKILGSITGELYTSLAMHPLLGTEATEEYTKKCISVAKAAPPASGTRLLWVHTLPYWVSPLRELLDFNNEAQIVGCDMTFEGITDTRGDDPYRAMARRVVFSSFNGPVTRRIKRGIEAAKRLKADGVVWFCHWGCKHTLGGAQIGKEEFEKAGFPCLILDGDGCDRSHGGEGQMGTRVEAFLEMLKGEKA